MDIDVEDPVAIFLRPSKFFKCIPPPPIVFKQKAGESKNSKSSGEDEVAIFFGDNKVVKTGFHTSGFFKPQPDVNLSMESKYPKKRKWSEIVHEENDVIESVSKRRCSNVACPSSVSSELYFFRGEDEQSFIDIDANSQRPSQEVFTSGKDCATTHLKYFNQNIDTYESHLANRQRMEKTIYSI